MSPSDQDAQAIARRERAAGRTIESVFLPATISTTTLMRRPSSSALFFSRMSFWISRASSLNSSSLAAFPLSACTTTEGTVSVSNLVSRRRKERK